MAKFKSRKWQESTDELIRREYLKWGQLVIVPWDYYLLSRVENAGRKEMGKTRE